MISFIVIGKNEGWRLEQCFNGIHSFITMEKIIDYEIIYVDSNSFDDSILIAKKNNITKVILITGECSPSIARQIGARESNGDILFFLDGDMELIPGFFHNIVDKNNHLTYPFISGIEYDVIHDRNWKFIKKIPRRRFEQGKDSYESTTGGLFIILASLWNKVNGMDTRFKYYEDVDLGLNLSKNQCPLCRKPLFFVNHFTISYYDRGNPYMGTKYQALLLRKHFGCIKAHKYIFKSSYSLYFLVISLALCVLLSSYFPLFLYLLSLLYKCGRIITKSPQKQHPLKIIRTQICKDFLLLYYFVTFYPQKPKIEYMLIQ